MTKRLRHSQALLATVILLLAITPAVQAPTRTMRDVGSATIPSRMSPLAAFTYNACVPCAVPGNLVMFNANNSASLYTNIILYTWNFGDNSSIVSTTNPLQNHLYFPSHTTWLVTITVTDANNQTDTVSQVVKFFDAPTFTVIPKRPAVEQQVIFNATGSHVYGNYTIKGYLWTLGDGTSAMGVITKHAYGLPGLYRITLTLVTPYGNPEISRTVRVGRAILEAIFDNINVTITGTITLDTGSKTATSLLEVTAVNMTSAKTIYSKTLNFTLGYSSDRPPSFVIVIPVDGYSLGASCTVSLAAGDTICMLSKNPDLNDEGTINIVDLATIAASYGSISSSPNWNRNADLNGDGTVNILDLAITGSDFGARVIK